MFSGYLKEMGFTINPYFANKIIGRKLCTAWNVDDMKTSHFNPDVVTIIIQGTKESLESCNYYESISTSSLGWTYTLGMITLF